MTIYRFEKLISFIPAYSTIFIVVVSYIKAISKKLSLLQWFKFFFIITCLFFILAYLYDDLLVNFTEQQQLLISTPVYWPFNLWLVNWQEEVFDSK